MASVTHINWSSGLRHRPLLVSRPAKACYCHVCQILTIYKVFLDRVQAFDPLDSADTRGLFHRIRRSVHFPTVLQLLGRRISSTVSLYFSPMKSAERC
jgi:hypothetical protein